MLFYLHLLCIAWHTLDVDNSVVLQGKCKMKSRLLKITSLIVILRQTWQLAFTDCHSLTLIATADNVLSLLYIALSPS